MSEGHFDIQKQCGVTEMEQTYIEVLVAREQNTMAGLLKILCGILAVISALLMMPIPVLIVGIPVFAWLSYYFYLQEWVEYEYSYVSRELTVDKIMARSKRKNVAVYLLDKIEIAAPQGSYRLDGYQNRKCTVKDYSGAQNSPKMVFYYEGNQKVILDADEGLLKTLQGAAPSKVFLH